MLDGEKAVETGLIDHLGGLNEAIACLYEMIEGSSKPNEKSKTHSKAGGKKKK